MTWFSSRSLHGDLAVQGARHDQVVHDADGYPHDADDLGGHVKRKQQREDHDHAQDGTDQKTHGVAVILLPEPEPHDHTEVEQKVRGKGTEVHDLAQSLHADEQKGREQDERESRHEARGDDGHLALLVDLGQDAGKRSALAHDVENARYRHRRDQAGEDALSQSHGHGADDAEPLAAHQLGDMVEAVVLVVLANLARRVDAGGDEARQDEDGHEDDDHDHHRARRPVSLVLRLVGERGNASEAHEREHRQRGGAHDAGYREGIGIEQGGQRETARLGVSDDVDHTEHDEHAEHDELEDERDAVDEHRRAHAA